MIIGLTVTMLISFFAPWSMDFGPRLFSALAGWGRVSFATNGPGWLTVYILAPIRGGQVGAILYRFFFRLAYALAASID